MCFNTLLTNIHVYPNILYTLKGKRDTKKEGMGSERTGWNGQDHLHCKQQLDFLFIKAVCNILSQYFVVKHCLCFCSALLNYTEKLERRLKGNGDTGFTVSYLLYPQRST